MEIRRRPPNPSVKVANLEYAISHEEAAPRNVLEKIVWQKDFDIAGAKKNISLEKLKKQISSLQKPHDFLEALRRASMKPAVIAEIKKASPSKGIIREDFVPCEIASSYIQGGATCLSVLTDQTFFKGGFDVLKEVRAVADIPILCKDFIISPYQIYQARACGADAVLLIAAILSDQDLVYLRKIAFNLGLSVLVEVHDSFEMERILGIGSFPLIGINNRNLTTFETDLDVTKTLAKKYRERLLDQNSLLVSESGLFTNDDLRAVNLFGAEAVLVGESLMRQEDLILALRNLMGN